MQVIKGTKYAYFDVDSTLVYSPSERDLSGFIFDGKGQRNIGGILFESDDYHVQLLKEFKARGFTIIVWSAAGAEWCEKICKEFELSMYVDLCIGKPDWFIDDKPSYEFMSEEKRTYISGE